MPVLTCSCFALTYLRYEFAQIGWRALMASPLMTPVTCTLKACLTDTYFRQADIVKLAVAAEDWLVVKRSVDSVVDHSALTQPARDWSVAVVGSELDVVVQAPPFPIVVDFGVNPQRMFGLRMVPNPASGGILCPTLTSITVANAAGPWDCVRPFAGFVGNTGQVFCMSSGAVRPLFSKSVFPGDCAHIGSDGYWCPS
jgi:hypothetical protein